MAVLPERVLFGAAYYHEYQPYERLETDLDLMVQAGFTVIRVGESVWSTWEPENGRFELDWLQPVLDGAHERGISVVLGTPTYAVPPWLARQYPEIAARRADGRMRRLGSPAGGRLHPPRLPLPRRTRHAQDRRTVRRPPLDHRVPGGQRTGRAPAAQPRRVPALRRPPARHLRRRREPEPRVGPGVLVPPVVGLGRPVDAGGQRPAAVRRRVAGVPGAADHGVRGVAGLHRPRVRAAGAVRHHLPALPARGSGRRRADRPRGRHRRKSLLRHAGRAHAARPHAGRPRAGLEDQGSLGVLPRCRLDLLLPSGTVPGHRDQRREHRHALGQPSRLRRPVAPGGLGFRRPRRADDRVLALAHAALRRGDLLGRRAAAQRPARSRSRRARAAGSRVRDRGRGGRGRRAGRRHRDRPLAAQQVAHAEVPTAVHSGRWPGRRRVPADLRLVLPRRVRGGTAGADDPRRSAARPGGGRAPATPC